MIPTLNNDTVFSLGLHRQETEIESYLAFVFYAQYQNTLNNIENILHENERRYFNNLKSERRRFSYLTGRFVAKLAICEYLHEIDMTQIEITSGIFDQPIVKHLSFDTPSVTISHCSDLSIAIACQQGHIMGIDVEEIDFNKTHVFKSQLTDDEISKSESNFKDTRLGYNLIWTAKESLSKAIKCGLTVPFSVLEIDKIEHVSDNAYLSNYKNFAQYKCYSWFTDKHLISITLPRKTETTLNIAGKIIALNAQF